MTMLDFAPLARSSIGFDRLFHVLDQASRLEPNNSFPSYDIEKAGENDFRITLAVPGFTVDELSLESRPNLLLVSGQKAERKNGEYFHRGLPAASFEQRFSLAPTVKVVGASLENGLLVIDLKREVPEAMQPRRIEIETHRGVQTPQQIDGQQAA
ncbi:MAG: molecular chaperone Hsp20 [Rhodospirillales bacterium]|nr:molecular chaperone Hsp20 [Rhodospirillales bacterium]